MFELLRIEWSKINRTPGRLQWGVERPRKGGSGSESRPPSSGISQTRPVEWNWPPACKPGVSIIERFFVCPKDNACLNYDCHSIRGEEGRLGFDMGAWVCQARVARSQRGLASVARTHLGQRYQTKANIAVRFVNINCCYLPEVQPSHVLMSFKWEHNLVSWITLKVAGSNLIFCIG